MNTLDSVSVQTITKTILTTFPKAQGIYLFGSFANNTANADSDIDLAILLPHREAKQVGSLALSPLHLELEKQLKRTVDLINLRLVSTVLQKEITMQGQLLLNQDAYAVDEFEMLTLSFYQKLNEERKELLEEFYLTGKAFAV